jgi:complex III assembly factor LYRM7
MTTTTLSAYRHLLRAARLTFKGDPAIYGAAQSQIRDGFRQNASLDPASPEVPNHIKHAEEVAKILRENVVQGQKKEGDTYSTFPNWGQDEQRRAGQCKAASTRES